MSKKSERAQSRRHVMVYDEDWAWLEANFGSASEKKIGVGTMIKRIVHTYVRRLRQNVEDRMDSGEGG